MTTPTPGPWRYEITEHGRRIGGGPQYLTPIAYPAEMNPGGVTPPLDVVDANMRLIAAAPELLDMLKTIENDGKQVPAWLWDRIQATIAKAEGAPPPAGSLTTEAVSNRRRRNGGGRD